MRMKAIALVLLCVLLTACSAKPDGPTWQEQYDLGLRYLEEGNYEEAILAFTAAIEIDPKQAEAYVGLAKAYIATEEYEYAKETILDGIAECGAEESLNQLLDEIELASKGVPTIISENFLLQSELTINKRPFYDLSIYDVRNLFGDEIFEEDLAKVCEDGTYAFYNGNEYAANSHINADTLAGFEYKYYRISSPDEIIGPSPEFRNIGPMDTIESLLSKIGFTKAGIESILSSNNSHVVLIDQIELSDRSMVQVECNCYPNVKNTKIVTISWDNWQMDNKPQQVKLELDFTKEGYLSKIQCACTDDKGAYFYVSA